jgi:hypothetical protein
MVVDTADCLSTVCLLACLLLPSSFPRAELINTPPLGPALLTSSATVPHTLVARLCVSSRSFVVSMSLAAHCCILIISCSKIAVCSPVMYCHKYGVPSSPTARFPGSLTAPSPVSPTARSAGLIAARFKKGKGAVGLCPLTPADKTVGTSPRVQRCTPDRVRRLLTFEEQSGTNT